MAHLVDHLPNKHKTLSANSSTKEEKNSICKFRLQETQQYFLAICSALKISSIFRVIITKYSFSVQLNTNN
jgi:hypothetical protein